MHELHYVGQRMQRPDALAKATGAAQYTADLVVHRRDVLHAKALYPPYGHAKILRIDTSKAAALPGVAIVMTADDLPGDQPLLKSETVVWTLLCRKASANQQVDRLLREGQRSHGVACFRWTDY